MTIQSHGTKSPQTSTHQGHHTAAPAPTEQAIVQPLNYEVLQPKDVIRLQRLVGNRAAQSLLRPARTIAIQRAFDNKATFLGKTDALDVNLQAIGDLLNSYNTFLALAVKAPDDYQTGFGVLKQLDRAINTWLTAASAAHTKLDDAPHYTQIEALRMQAQTEHADLVDSIKGTDIIPFDLGPLPFSEQLKLIQLWYRIKDGTGKIKLVGDAANKKAMLSDLTKLLDTPTGRKLLGFLDAGDPAEAMTNIYIGQTKEQLPGGVQGTATKLENRAVSEAQPLVAGAAGMGVPTSTSEYRGPMALDGTENPRDFTIATSAADFREATVSGKLGVILNGQKYLFNRGQGVGAFVSVHDGASRNENAAHHQIATPRHVTLGHELGHAAHMRAGGTAMVNEGIMQQLGGAHAEKLTDTWQNSEELLTIQGWENSIRGDVGLPDRASHIPYTAGKKIERKWILMDDFRTSFTRRDPFFTGVTAVGNFSRDLKAAISTLDQDGVYNPLHARLQTLKATIGDDQLVTWKTAQLRDNFVILRTRYIKKTFPPKDMKRQYKAIKHDLRDNMLTYTRVEPTTPYDDMLERIKDLSYKMRAW
jgi:hypothetical protein